MAQLQFGLIVPENPRNPPHRVDYLDALDRLLTTVTGHFASAWSIDHLDGDVLEGWTAVSYLAALHPQLEWGHTVLSQSFRNPALLAKMGATLQFLSGGRFVLGLGAGGQEAEYRAYGYPFPRGRTRVEELEETLQIITAMWTQERVTFEGRHHRVENAMCEPKPYPIPPVVIGAFGPKMLRLTARHADGWNVSSTGIADYQALTVEMERACAETGRDPATVRRIWSSGCVCAPTEAEVAALAAPRQRLGPEFEYQPGEDLIGTPAQIIEQMEPFIALGVDCFLLDCGGFPRLTTVETLINDVLPAFER
jgi:alkanesulfonate monooxygenase SsuD/methylene tetrahydromethanopterin reductase-like flavin-dependent oxidoreductase (luciferase family)